MVNVSVDVNSIAYHHFVTKQQQNVNIVVGQTSTRKIQVLLAHGVFWRFVVPVGPTERMY